MISLRVFLISEGGTVAILTSCVVVSKPPGNTRGKKASKSYAPYVARRHQNLECSFERRWQISGWECQYYNFHVCRSYLQPQLTRTEQL